jgi:hypothetical protein
LPSAFDQATPSPRFPDPIRLEQGSRIAGLAVGKLFPWYFAIQTACALVALGSGLVLARFARPATRLETFRLVVLVLGLLSVLAGWGLERYVEELRVERNGTTDAVLQQPDSAAGMIAAAESARARFGAWHGVSLLVNFAALGLAGLGLALAGHLAKG